jgi:Winged helix-turn helix
MARIARGDEFADQALQVIASASTVEELRQAQAVILPLLFSAGSANNATASFKANPWAMAVPPARGGRRRENFSLEKESALLEPFLEQAKEGGVLIVGQIKPHIEEALGRSVSLSSVYALLHRHNWRKLTPDKRHPKSDPKSDTILQEEWKKNSPKRSKRSAQTG